MSSRKGAFLFIQNLRIYYINLVEPIRINKMNTFTVSSSQEISRDDFRNRLHYKTKMYEQNQG
jgi:hypothetical protein